MTVKARIATGGPGGHEVDVEARDTTLDAMSTAALALWTATLPATPQPASEQQFGFSTGLPASELGPDAGVPLAGFPLRRSE